MTNQAKNELAEAQAQLQWIGECIEGQDVSEFAESFPLVKAVSDLRTAKETAEENSERWHQMYQSLDRRATAIQTELDAYKLENK